jgi:hypothetical protein
VLVPIDNLNPVKGYKRVYGVGVDAVINARLKPRCDKAEPAKPALEAVEFRPNGFCVSGTEGAGL